MSLSDFSGAQLGYFHGNSFFAAIDTISAVPEPSTLVLAALGFIGLTAWGWRQRGLVARTLRPVVRIGADPIEPVAVELRPVGDVGQQHLERQKP